MDAPDRQPWLDSYWLQGAFDALRATLAVDTDLQRQMIDFLFAEGFWDHTKLSWAGAQARFHACLNPAKPDAFKLVEIWALCKRFHRHELVLAMVADLGYERPRPLATEEHRNELLERIARASEVQAAAMLELQRMASPPPPVRMHPTLRSGEARFSQQPAMALGDTGQADPQQWSF